MWEIPEKTEVRKIDGWTGWRYFKWILNISTQSIYLNSCLSLIQCLDVPSHVQHKVVSILIFDLFTISEITLLNNLVKLLLLYISFNKLSVKENKLESNAASL